MTSQERRKFNRYVSIIIDEYQECTEDTGGYPPIVHVHDDDTIFVCGVDNDEPYMRIIRAAQALQAYEEASALAKDWNTSIKTAIHDDGLAYVGIQL